MGDEAGTEGRAAIPRECLRDYFLYKGFDVISDGAYKKLIIKSREENDPQACQLYANVQRVSAVLKEVQSTVASLHEYGKHRLQKVCLEVFAHSTPPTKVKQCWNTCAISGIRSQQCLDLTRAGKSETVLMVHLKFSHFIIMLWVLCKFEHLCKAYTRKWIQGLPAEVSEGGSVQQLCKELESDSRNIEAWYLLFTHAHGHVLASLAAYKQIPCYETIPRVANNVS